MLYRASQDVAIVCARPVYLLRVFPHSLSVRRRCFDVVIRRRYNEPMSSSLHSRGLK